MLSNRRLDVVVAIVLSYSRGVLSAPQPATVNLFPLGFENVSLSGSIIGTGSLGTAYELGGTMNGLGFTMTVIEGEGDMVETADVPDASGNTLHVAAACTIEGSAAVCHEVLQEGASSTSVLATGVFAPFPVVITSAAGGASPSPIGTISILPPTITPSLTSHTNVPGSSTSSGGESSVVQFPWPSLAFGMPTPPSGSPTPMSGGGRTAQAPHRVLFAIPLAMVMWACLYV